MLNSAELISTITTTAFSTGPNMFCEKGLNERNQCQCTTNQSHTLALGEVNTHRHKKDKRKEREQ